MQISLLTPKIEHPNAGLAKRSTPWYSTSLNGLFGYDLGELGEHATVGRVASAGAGVFGIIDTLFSSARNKEFSIWNTIFRPLSWFGITALGWWFTKPVKNEQATNIINTGVSDIAKNLRETVGENKELLPLISDGTTTSLNGLMNQIGQKAYNIIEARFPEQAYSDDPEKMILRPFFEALKKDVLDDEAKKDEPDDVKRLTRFLQKLNNMNTLIMSGEEKAFIRGVLQELFSVEASPANGSQSQNENLKRSTSSARSEIEEVKSILDPILQKNGLHLLDLQYEARTNSIIIPIASVKGYTSKNGEEEKLNIPGIAIQVTPQAFLFATRGLVAHLREVKDSEIAHAALGTPNPSKEQLEAINKEILNAFLGYLKRLGTLGSSRGFKLEYDPKEKKYTTSDLYSSMSELVNSTGSSEIQKLFELAGVDYSSPGNPLVGEMGILGMLLGGIFGAGDEGGAPASIGHRSAERGGLDYSDINEDDSRTRSSKTREQIIEEGVQREERRRFLDACLSGTVPLGQKKRPSLGITLNKTDPENLKKLKIALLLSLVRASEYDVSVQNSTQNMLREKIFDVVFKGVISAKEKEVREVILERVRSSEEVATEASINEEVQQQLDPFIRELKKKELPRISLSLDRYIHPGDAIQDSETFVTIQEVKEILSRGPFLRERIFDILHEEEINRRRTQIREEIEKRIKGSGKDEKDGKEKLEATSKVTIREEVDARIEVEFRERRNIEVRGISLDPNSYTKEGLKGILGDQLRALRKGNDEAFIDHQIDLKVKRIKEILDTKLILSGGQLANIDSIYAEVEEKVCDAINDRLSITGENTGAYDVDSGKSRAIAGAFSLKDYLIVTLEGVIVNHRDPQKVKFHTDGDEVTITVKEGNETKTYKASKEIDLLFLLAKYSPEATTQLGTTKARTTVAAMFRLERLFRVLGDDVAKPLRAAAQTLKKELDEEVRMAKEQRDDTPPSLLPSNAEVGSSKAVK